MLGSWHRGPRVLVRESIRKDALCLECVALLWGKIAFEATWGVPKPSESVSTRPWDFLEFVPKSPGHDRLRLSQVREFLRVAPPSVACQVQRTRASSPQLTAKHTIPSIYQELQAFATATMVVKTEKVRLFARREQTRQKKRLRRLAIEGMF